MNSIFHRISVRKYEDRPVEKEKIMEILLVISSHGNFMWLRIKKKSRNCLK